MKISLSLDTTQLLKALAATNEKVSEAAKKTIAEHLPKVEAKARELAPERTGALKEAIETRQSAGGHYGSIRINAKKAPHGHLVVYGSVNMPANPFLQQARDALQGELKENLAQNIKQQVNE